MRKNKLLFAITSLVTLLSLLLSLVACDTTPDSTPTPTPSGPAEYTVTVTSEYGLPLSAVYVLVHDEASPNPNSTLKRGQTDRDGRVSFELESSKTYSFKLLDLPAGYSAEDKYFFDAERKAELKLASSPITDSTVGSVDEYSVGDIIHDMTLTTLDGASYSLSEVLGENELLVLNFWYTSCGPCLQEFPTLIGIYGEYKDAGIEIFAINDNGDHIGHVRDFTVTVNGEAIPLPFPTFKADDETNGYRTCELLSKFGSAAYPTSVFIDRAGMICYVHYGVIEEADLIRLIEHFTAEEYVQRAFSRLSDI